MSPTRPIAGAAALLAAGLALAACQKSQPAQAPSPGALPAPKPPTAEQARYLADLPPAYQHADLENGRLHFTLCRSCHTIVQGGPNMTGPNLYGLFGRKVASAPGYSYSPALSARAWSWNAAQLDGWLKSPRDDVPGTTMSFYGVRDDQDRRDLIAYLKVASSGGPAN